MSVCLWSVVDTDLTGQYPQQGNYPPAQAQSPAGYGPQQGVPFNGPPSAGGYGRGQQPPNQQQWSQGGPNQNYNNYNGGYQA